MVLYLKRITKPNYSSFGLALHLKSNKKLIHFRERQMRRFIYFFASQIRFFDQYF